MMMRSGRGQGRAAGSPLYRNGYLRWIEGAKRPETRSARIAETLGLLKAGKKQRYSLSSDLLPLSKA
jgi:hypothetical protein